MFNTRPKCFCHTWSQDHTLKSTELLALSCPGCCHLAPSSTKLALKELPVLGGIRVCARGYHVGWEMVSATEMVQIKCWESAEEEEALTASGRNPGAFLVDVALGRWKEQHWQKNRSEGKCYNLLRRQ